MGEINNQLGSAANQKARNEMLSKARDLVEEMRKVSTGGEGAAGVSTSTPTGEFAQIFKDAIGGVNETSQNASKLIKAYELGDKSVSLTDVILAVQKARVGSQFAMHARNHVMEAYKNIMNMPI